MLYGIQQFFCCMQCEISASLCGLFMLQRSRERKVGEACVLLLSAGSLQPFFPQRVSMDREFIHLKLAKWCQKATENNSSAKGLAV